MFQIYDVDGDGIVSASDMQLVLRQLAGSSISDSQIKSLIAQVESAAEGWEGGLKLDQFAKALEGCEICMEADLPEGDV